MRITLVAAATNTVAHAIANDVARTWGTGLVVDLVPSEQLKLMKKLLTDHKILIEQREYAKSMAEKDIHQWKKVITPLKEKQMTLCEVVLKLCDISVSHHH